MRSNFACFTSHAASAFTAALLWTILVPAASAQQDARNAEIARLKAIADAQQKQIEALTQQQKIIQDRLLADIEALTRSVKERDAALDKLQHERKRLQLDAVNLETRAKAAEIRSQELLKQLREMMGKLRSQPAADPVTPNPAAPNPPATRVNGKIEKIDGDLFGSTSAPTMA